LKSIDLQTWPRRSQYRFFRGLAPPHYSVTAAVDVTYLVTYLKPAGISVFNATLFAIVGAANAIPELRMRFRAEQVVEHDIVHASVTVPIGDDGFGFCNIEYADDWHLFDARCSDAVARAKRQTGLRDDVAHMDDWFYMSCLPWVDFTAMTNPVDGPDDCVPRVTWGKFVQHSGAWRLSVSVQVHHALVDGLHLGRFYETLQSRLTLPLG
jgi:chloramphenicol O-acetyltransferase type A